MTRTANVDADLEILCGADTAARPPIPSLTCPTCMGEGTLKTSIP